MKNWSVKPPRLRRAFDSPESKRRYVRGLFATIADRYDLITVVLSWGRDRAWKRVLVSRALASAEHRGRSVAGLDLACGTGDIAFGLASGGVEVVGLDITPRMVELARAKGVPPETSPAVFLVGDMMALPFSDESFDLVTTGYGLRNVPALASALREIHRVLRPGGRMYSLDFDRPASAPLRAAYLGYLTVVGSLLGLLLHRDPDTYRYIPASLARYVGARGVAAAMRELGFQEVGHAPLLGGLMAMNWGEKGRQKGRQKAGDRR